GPDGSLYLAQNSHPPCVVRLSPNGRSPYGRFTHAFGGLKGRPQPRTVCGVAVGPDGALYVADGEAHVVWRVGPDGSAAVVAGTGPRGFPGAEGPADRAARPAPSGVPVGPAGSVSIADCGTPRVRRVGPDGVVATVAGTGAAPYGSPAEGDGGDARRAPL